MTSSPGRLERRSAALRAGGLALAGLLSLANATSAALLVNELAHGSAAESAAALLLAGGSIWAANVLIFALWHWELDRGGPADRCHAVRMYPDFLFPQMQQPDLAPAGLKPSFTDCSCSAGVAPNVARRRRCETCASGLSSGEIQSTPAPVGSTGEEG